ncbi:MAG: DUF924 family protein [Candidatus Accumulibacter sp.]|nr:DUF924 family protein [Accumulibacter sp.]MBO3705603.1 DUF924 family protein [Candidatus Accumulibacter conexus]
MTAAEVLHFWFEETQPAQCPDRNAVLGRPSTAAEIEFLRTPGSAF